MKRNISFMLVIFITGLFLYFFNFKYYFRAWYLILKNNTNSENIKLIQENFLGDGLDNKSYRGTLAKIDDCGDIWVWGRTGLKRFYKDDNSVYRFLDGCQKELLYPNKENAGKTFEFSELVTWDVKEWQNSGVKVGDFVIVNTRKKINFIGGIVGEVYTFNNWFFLEEKLYDSCIR